MKNILQIILLLTIGLFISGCSSQTSKARSSLSSSGDELTTEEEELLAPYADYKNTDFNSSDIPYESDEDLYSDSAGDVLSKETMSRLEPVNVSEEAKMKDPSAEANSLCYQKQYEAAFKRLDAAYKQFKQHPSYWTAIGNCYYSSNQLRKAQLYYDKAIDLDKKYAPSLNNLGVIYQHLGDDQRALNAYTKAAENNPYSLTPLFNKAQLFLQYGLPEDALEIFKVLLAKGDGDNEVLAGMATSYFFLNDFNKAQEYFSKVNSRYLVRPDVGINYAYALYALGNKRQASNILGKVNLKYKPSWTNQYQQLVKLVGE